MYKLHTTQVYHKTPNTSKFFVTTENKTILNLIPELFFMTKHYHITKLSLENCLQIPDLTDKDIRRFVLQTTHVVLLHILCLGSTKSFIHVTKPR